MEMTRAAHRLRALDCHRVSGNALVSQPSARLGASLRSKRVQGATCTFAVIYR
jgi:hypothetical protein